MRQQTGNYCYPSAGGQREEVAWLTPGGGIADSPEAGTTLSCLDGAGALGKTQLLLGTHPSPFLHGKLSLQRSTPPPLGIQQMRNGTEDKMAQDQSCMYVKF